MGSFHRDDRINLLQSSIGDSFDMIRVSGDGGRGSLIPYCSALSGRMSFKSLLVCVCRIRASYIFPKHGSTSDTTLSIVMLCLLMNMELANISMSALLILFY